ncbi:MAG: N-acetylmuramoyl-L-alanine amidase, partial [Clostridia bacterium]|nr:N-acetylmuramoyl-L-alanine amidase [Clostridia bacterium]
MKNHRFRRIFAIITLILIGGTIITGTVLQGQAEAPRITIAVDAGHGGTDGGAVAKDGTTEKDLNLSIAILLREELEKRGAEVILTRTADDDTDGSAEGFFKKK